jgi:hypothetical protein
MLREALPDEVWINYAPSETVISPEFKPQSVSTHAINDATPPSAPANVKAKAGLFSVEMSWDAVTDNESGIQYYAYAIGTGANETEQANLMWWQANNTDTKARAAIALTEGQKIFVSVYAVNGAGHQSQKARSLPVKVERENFGEASNTIRYVFAPNGIDANGNSTNPFTPQQQNELGGFLDKMLPVLIDLYGAPSISYTVSIVRDLRRTNSAIFFPNSDEIHMGDTATYQLLTHEMIHAFRNDRILSSNALWQYDPTLSGFEEGFAQAVSYAAMTEFARRYPEYPLTQKVYQSSVEWDYDFQNVPQLRTKDFWSDFGGTQLHWIRYETAATALAKIATGRADFYRAFNAEYYRRLNDNPTLTVSRELIVNIIDKLASTIEGKPTSDWIDAQYVLACDVTPGQKVWHYTQHYPSREYFIFNRTHTYETFVNGSDWAYLDNSQWKFYASNGISGKSVWKDFSGAPLVTKTLLISPTTNPPTTMSIGWDEINLTTQASHLPWPGGDGTKYITNLLPLELYRLETTFSTTATQTSSSVYRVIGAELRNASGVWGGVIGANGGKIQLNHRDFPAEPALNVTNGAFWGTRAWATLTHTETNSIDSAPGVVDVIYIDATGKAYTDTRSIQIGSWSGNQAFLFDVSTMFPVDGIFLTPTPLSNLTRRVYLPVVIR